jgi:hypothetical protein
MTAQDTGWVSFPCESYCCCHLKAQFKLQGSCVLGTRLKQWILADLTVAFLGPLKTTLTSTRVAGTKIVPPRSRPMNPVLPCLRQSFGLTKREAAPRGKNWKQRRAAGSGGVSQPLYTDATIFVPVTLARTWWQMSAVISGILTSMGSCHYSSHTSYWSHTYLYKNTHYYTSFGSKVLSRCHEERNKSWN